MLNSSFFVWYIQFLSGYVSPLYIYLYFEYSNLWIFGYTLLYCDQLVNEQIVDVDIDYYPFIIKIDINHLFSSWFNNYTSKAHTYNAPTPSIQLTRE